MQLTQNKSKQRNNTDKLFLCLNCLILIFKIAHTPLHNLTKKYLNDSIMKKIKQISSEQHL